MDVISLGKAKKAQEAIAEVQDRLGMNGSEQGSDVTDQYNNVKEQLEELEKKDPQVIIHNCFG